MSRLRTDVDIMPENELNAWIDNILSNVHLDFKTINDVLTRELKIDKLQRLAKRILRPVIDASAPTPRIPIIVYSVLATGK